MDTAARIIMINRNSGAIWGDSREMGLGGPLEPVEVATLLDQAVDGGQVHTMDYGFIDFNGINWRTLPENTVYFAYAVPMDILTWEYDGQDKAAILEIENKGFLMGVVTRTPR